MLCCLLRVLNVSLNLYCVRETPVFGLGLEKAAITGLFSSSSSDVAEGLYWFVQTHYRKYKSLNSASNFPIIVMSLASFPGNEGREDGVYQQVELSDETDGFQLCQEIETVSVHIHISCHGVTARQ